MKKLIIFGNDDLAEVAYFYFKNDSNYDVCAFTVDSEYIKENKFNNLPVYPFEKIQDILNPNDYDIFIAVGYSKLNKTRTEKYVQAKQKGYCLASYLSSKATYWKDITLGENCFILEDNTLQPFVSIGNNVFMWSGNHIGHHAVIKDNCFITSHVVISGRVIIEENCFIGVNATINDHIKIGKDSVIGSGALITKNSEQGCIYKSKPTLIYKKEIEQIKYFK